MAQTFMEPNSFFQFIIDKYAEIYPLNPDLSNMIPIVPPKNSLQQKKQQMSV